MTSPVVGYAGMTHLGLNSAVGSAALGFEMVCFDNDKDVIENLNNGKPPIVEPDLTDLMEKHKGSITYSTDVKSLEKCQVVYVAPDIPTNDKGESNIEPLVNLIEQVDAALPAHIVLVVLSQIPPGFSRTLNLKEGRQYYYQVETLIFGRAIERVMYPERFIIGCDDPDKPLHKDFEAYLKGFKCPLLPMRYESAELAKISINCCLVASVTVANTLAELCENIGADWSEIVPALKLDRRIGQYSYLQPGLGIAGGNLERDLNTVRRFSDQYGTDSRMIQSWIDNSRYRKDWVLRTLHQDVLIQIENPKIGIWGLAYKQDTHSVKNSPSLAFIEHLNKFEVQAYDPVVPATAVPNMEVKQASDCLDACEGVDVLAIMTPWGQFKDIDPKEVAARMKGTIVIDPYVVLDGKACKAAGLTYITLGVKDL